MNAKTKAASTGPARSQTVVALVIVLEVVLLAIWALGMGGVIHLALPLVWIIPFACLVMGAVTILWRSGLFDS